MKYDKLEIIKGILLVLASFIITTGALTIMDIWSNHGKEPMHTQIIVNESGPNINMVHKNVTCPVCNKSDELTVTPSGLDNGVYVGYCKRDGTLFEFT